MTDKKQLYNSALTLIGERQLEGLDENVESRYVLDSVWDEGAVDYCLEQGQWRFATRGVKLDYSPDITPTFGYRYGFEKPADFVRITSVCSDPYYNSPLLTYTEEAGFWFTDLTEIYIKYVSNSDAFGNNLGLWPQSFKKYVAAYLAFEASARLTADKDKREMLFNLMKKRHLEAKSKDAMAEPTQFPPVGSWVRSRTRGNYTRKDGGNRNTLIG